MRTGQLLIAVAFTALLGCGGGTFGGSNQASMNISASAPLIDYGQTVTITWSGHLVDHIDTASTNFQSQPSLVNGSLVDTPANDTTYVVTGVDKDGHKVQATVSVQVRPSTKQFLVVGDQSLAGVPQVTEYVQKLTAKPVVTSLGWPSAMTADVILVLPSASIGTGERAKVSNYLKAGGRLVLVGTSIHKLATGNAKKDDISSIGSWFAGATHSFFSFKIDHVTDTYPGIPLSSVWLGDIVAKGLPVSPVSSKAINLEKVSNSGSNAFAYQSTTGGKLAYVGGASVGSSDQDAALNSLLFSLCRWAADSN